MTRYECLSLLVQTVVGIAIVGTFVVYYLQLRTMQRQLTTTRDQLDSVRDASRAQNILSVINFLQSEDVRSARTIVRRDLRGKPMAEWDNLEQQAASRVCSTYDIAGILLREGLVPLAPFLDNWGPSIRDCYVVLLPYIRKMQLPEHSGPSYWNDFGWLYK